MRKTTAVLGVAVVVLFLHVHCSSQIPIADEIEKTIDADGIEAAVARYHELKRVSPDRYDFGIDQLRPLAEKLYESGKVSEAIRLAELNAGSFPDSPIVYYDLARAFHYSGDPERSKQNILKSMELDPLRLASVILKKKIFFVPDDFEVPTRLETEDFLIRPLLATDVDLDYEAVMSSIEHLRGVFGPGNRWPMATLTREEDLADLERHEADFKRRDGFTYTVMNPSETKCLGCLYIYPSKLDTYDSQIVMWVTTEAYENGLDPVLENIVREWIGNSWTFAKVIYPGRDIEWPLFNERLGKQDEKYH